MNYQFLQAWVLRLVGAVEILAFAAVLEPRDWMESTHRWLGFTDMPQGPLFDSVMRQVSFTYGVHGVALWILASDVDRYRPLVILTAIGYLVAGPVFFVIDFGNRMPMSWIVANGGSCLVIGTLLSGLLWGDRAREKSKTLPDRQGSPQGARDQTPSGEQAPGQIFASDGRTLN